MRDYAADSVALFVGCLILLGGLGSPCMAASECIENPPEWVTHRRDDTPFFLYAIGAATGQRSLEDARTKAFDDALQQFAKRIAAEVEVDSSSSQTTLQQSIEGAELFPGAEYSCSGATHSVWLLVRYPREAFEAEAARRRRPFELWQRAEAAFAASEGTSEPSRKAALESEGRDSLRLLIAEYQIGVQGYFETERALFRLAERSLAAGNPCAARECFRQIRSHSKTETWIARAAQRIQQVECSQDDWERHVLGQRFSLERVGLSCCLDAGDSTSSYPQLYSSTSQLLSSAGAVVSEITCTDARRAPTGLRINLKVEGHGRETENGRYVFTGTLTSRITAGEQVIFADQFPAEVSQRNREVCLYVAAESIAAKWRSHLVEALGGGLQDRVTR